MLQAFWNIFIPLNKIIKKKILRDSFKLHIFEWFNSKLIFFTEYNTSSMTL